MRPDSKVERAAVVNEVLTWLRTPHHHGAAVKGAGVDCGRLLIEVFATCGLIEPIEVGPYPYDYHLHRNEEKYLPLVERFAQPVRGRAVLPGDIALFQFGRVISHGGVMMESPEFVHAHVYQGVVRDSLAANVMFRERLVGYWSVWD